MYLQKTKEAIKIKTDEKTIQELNKSLQQFHKDILVALKNYVHRGSFNLASAIGVLYACIIQINKIGIDKAHKAKDIFEKGNDKIPSYLG